MPAVLLIAGGVLARGDPQPGRELPRVREPGEVADLGDQPERGQRRDPTEPGQDLHLAAPALAAGDLAKPSVERVELTLDPVDVDQQLLERFPREGIVEALAREPATVQLRPRRLALPEDPAVAQQLLEHPVTRRQPRAAQIITRAQQIAQPLELRGRGMHEPQHASAIQRHELLRVTAIGLDAVTGTDRDQRRRDHIARHAHLRQQSPQREPARPRLIADRQARPGRPACR